MDIPQPTGNLYQWATKVVGYLRSKEQEQKVPSPRPVQLEHRMAGAKATKDGLLMWDPTAGQMIVAIGGVWYKVALDGTL